MKIKNYVNSLIIAVLFFVNSSAYAIPGQTESTFLKWSSANPVLKNIKKVGSICAQSEEPNYTKEFILTGSKVYFNTFFNCNTKTVDRDIIYIESNFSDAKMVTLVEKIMGKDVLNDMMLSKILFNSSAKIYDGSSLDFLVLKGPKYGYVIEKYPIADKFFSVYIINTNKIEEILKSIQSGEYMVY